LAQCEVEHAGCVQGEHVIDLKSSHLHGYERDRLIEEVGENSPSAVATS
jgi:hypothetical protein